MSIDKGPSTSPEKSTIPIDPRLEALPHAQLGPQSGDRDYGVISMHGMDGVSPRTRAELAEGIFRARANKDQMGVWSERVQLPDERVALFIFEAARWNDGRRVFGEAYVVSAERADEIEAVIVERTNEKRKQYIASLNKS